MFDISTVRLAAWTVVGMVTTAGSVQAGFSNGDFSQGLDSWTTMGDVGVNASGEAVMGDAVYRALLYAMTDASLNLLSITFDVQAELSGEVPAGTFPDAFFASVYFVDNLSTFDLDGGGFDGSMGLFDLDAQGVYNLSDSVTSTPIGGGWTRYAANVTAQTQYAVLAFELFDLNQTASDSRVMIDNVRVIPEPRSALLFLLALAWVRRRLPCIGPRLRRGTQV